MHTAYAYLRKEKLPKLAPGMTATITMLRWRERLPDVLRAFGCFLLCTLLLWRLVPWNGYPFLYAWDSGSYIDLGWSLQIPIAQLRPSGYGILLYISSLNLSLIFASIFQTAIIVLALQACVRHAAHWTSHAVFIGIILYLSLATRLSLLAAVIHPDVYTAGIFFIIYWYSESHRPWQQLSALLLLFLLATFHISFIHISALTCLLWGAVQRWPRSRWLPLLALHGIYYTLPIALQLAVPGTGSPTSHYFTVGRMAETGILQTYLERQCGHTPYLLCSNQDQLRNINVTEFVWKQHAWSPRADGSTQQDLLAIIRDMPLREPILFGRYLVFNALAALDAWAFAKPYTPHQFYEGERQSISRYLPADLPRAVGSKLSQSSIDLIPKFQGMYFGEIWGKFLALTIVLLFIVFVRRSPRTLPAKYNASVGTLCLLLANAFVCANASGVFERYFDRLHWLLIFIAIICTPDLYRELRILLQVYTKKRHAIPQSAL